MSHDKKTEEEKKATDDKITQAKATQASTTLSAQITPGPFLEEDPEKSSKKTPRGKDDKEARDAARETAKILKEKGFWDPERAAVAMAAIIEAMLAPFKRGWNFLKEHGVKKTAGVVKEGVVERAKLFKDAASSAVDWIINKAVEAKNFVTDRFKKPEEENPPERAQSKPGEEKPPEEEMPIEPQGAESEQEAILQGAKKDEGATANEYTEPEGEVVYNPDNDPSPSKSSLEPIGETPSPLPSSDTEAAALAENNNALQEAARQAAQWDAKEAYQEVTNPKEQDEPSEVSIENSVNSDPTSEYERISSGNDNRKSNMTDLEDIGSDSSLNDDPNRPT